MDEVSNWKLTFSRLTLEDPEAPVKQTAQYLNHNFYNSFKYCFLRTFSTRAFIVGPFQ